MASRDSVADEEKSIVVIGGGTGSYTVLWGLKGYTSRISAVVTMMDSGGSSGRLRDELGQLPPGDLRQCLVALSPGESTAVTLRRLFSYRFSKGGGLDGHNFGNLFLSALMEITGDANRAVREAGRMLGIRGQVLPVTLTNTTLYARLMDGTLIEGEMNIDVREGNADVPIDLVFLDPPAVANEPVLEAIASADAIVIGPGDLYSSIIPNLLVDGIQEAISASPARKIYVCNLMTKHGESDGFTASRFIREIKGYLGEDAHIDCAIVNNSEFPPELLVTYQANHTYPVEPDLESCAELVPLVLPCPLVAAGRLLRHDSRKLAQAVMGLLQSPVPVAPRER